MVSRPPDVADPARSKVPTDASGETSGDTTDSSPSTGGCFGGHIMWPRARSTLLCFQHSPSRPVRVLV